MKYIIFSVTHAHADNVDKLLLLLFELAAYLQRMMLKNGRGGREWGWGGEGAIDVGAKVLLVVVIAQSSTIVVAALLCLCLLCALRYARHISLSLCLSISLFPTLSSSLSLAVLLLCALQKRFYLFTAVFMYRELRIRKCKATQNMWALACIHMLVCTQGTCTYIYIYLYLYLYLLCTSLELCVDVMPMKIAAVRGKQHFWNCEFATCEQFTVTTHTHTLAHTLAVSVLHVKWLL